MTGFGLIVSREQQMGIRDWPKKERPREKLLGYGADALSEAELIACWLGSGNRGSSAIDLARNLLSTFGGLRGLFHAPRKVLFAQPGFGPVRFAQMQAWLELSRRYLAETLPRGPELTSPRATSRFLQARLRDLDHELFCALFLDNRHRVIRFQPLFRGTIDGASVHPRDVVKQALGLNAAALILAHNHPSGVADPSQADHLITRRLRDALALVDIRVLDHLVVGDGTCFSFAEQGFL